MSENAATQALHPASTRVQPRLDEALSIAHRCRHACQIWRSVAGVLSCGPLAAHRDVVTALALGYVQSGKTTSITALSPRARMRDTASSSRCSAATNLLLDQNRTDSRRRLASAAAQDYLWVVETNPTGPRAAKRADWSIAGASSSSRCSSTLAASRWPAAWDGCRATSPVLIVDDEADQASLNTQGRDEREQDVRGDPRDAEALLANHLYVQYTATPYAPLLLEPDDLLSPEFVEFLQPGPGYTGGREFFVDFAERVVRDVPTLDEQAPQAAAARAAGSLVGRASFVAGRRCFSAHDPAGARSACSCTRRTRTTFKRGTTSCWSDGLRGGDSMSLRASRSPGATVVLSARKRGELVRRDLDDLLARPRALRPS